MRDLSLFAGAGGGILAGLLLGWQTIAAVELDAYCRSVLALRWPGIALHDDVRTFDGRSLRGAVDVVSGGFPCQDISAAGRGAGIDGAQSGLWSEFARIISETEPTFAFVENSPRLRTRGLDRVLGDLAGLGFDAEWSCLSAEAVGAPHRRDRMWVLAAHSQRLQLWQQQGRQCGPGWSGATDLAEHGQAQPLADTKWAGHSGQIRDASSLGRETLRAQDQGGWWATEPDVGRVANGVAARSHRLRALGNGQVPLVAAVAFAGLARRFGVEVMS
jgi:DNA (cytosine-5)-methyltransferase 1